MINIGINGFGRIGKCIFLQLLHDDNINVKAINMPDTDIKDFEIYLKYDSIHKYNNNFVYEIINDKLIKINNNEIHILGDREPKNLNWKNYGIDIVIDATGAFLTTNKLLEHNVNKVIMCAPPKDNTPIYVYGGNHEKYNKEKVLSNASCTTNCIIPILKILDDNLGIKCANFTTIHATTASQTTTDILKGKNRINRSIFNNIIPYTTGATSSIFKILPNLENKICGTSLRVPVSNVSIVDLNIELNNDISIKELLCILKKSDIIEINNKNLVSSDFITTEFPSIIDENACIQLDKNKFKLMIWYDNEWSYSAQVIRLLKNII